MSNTIIGNIIRFVVIALIQVLVLRRINLGGPSFIYINLIFYPILLILLPLRTPKIALLFIGFFLGIFLDSFYETPGVHAAACVATAFIRPFLLILITPRGGYNVGSDLLPKHYGYPWFFRYASILTAIHLFIYFSLTLFSPIYFGQIFLKTLASFLFSMLFIAVYTRFLK